MSANLPSSILARLNASNARNARNPNETLVRYATEGFLRRLEKTPHRNSLPFDFQVLRTALEKTFSRRGAWPVSATPPALVPAFAETPARLALWTGFLRRTRLLDSAPSFPEACALLRTFLLPLLLPARALSKWMPKEGWT